MPVFKECFSQQKFAALVSCYFFAQSFAWMCEQPAYALKKDALVA